MQLLGLDIVSLCRSEICMTENWGCYTDVFWVFDGNAGHGTISKQMWVDRPAKGAFGHFGYSGMDGLACHWLTVLGDPQVIAVVAIEQYRPHLIYVVIDVRRWSGTGISIGLRAFISNP
jgi:hypothetical protein